MSREDRGVINVQEAAPFDRSSLQRRLGGDQSAASAALSAFAREAPRQLARLHDALEKGDTAQVKLIAHTMKGSLLWIGAEDVASTASFLEQAVLENSEVSPRDRLAALSKRVEQLVSQIAS